MMNRQQVFAARLARISAQDGNTNATLHIGMAEQVPQAALMRLNGAALRRLSGNRHCPSPLVMPVALFSGALALFGVHLGRVWLLPPDLAISGVLFDMTGALFAVLVLRVILGLHGLLSTTLQLTGVAIVALGLHNAVHQWPQVFAALFPPQWVTAVLDSTQPMSLSLGAFTL